MSGELRVLQTGPMTSVQDLGRPGFLRFGVSASGPVDNAAMRLANALVANDPGEAVIEFGLLGGQFELSGAARCAVTGGSVSVEVDGVRVPPWRAFHAGSGARISIGPLTDAVWGYVAISGGIRTLPVMGSRSTHLRNGIGGLDGRALRAGDVLPIGEGRDAPLLALVRPYRLRSGPIHVVSGPQDHLFDLETLRLFAERSFRATSERDRLAMILDGPPLRAAKGHDVVSDGTVMGSIQVPPSGRPVVLMADRQSTGGYAKIATVVTSDVARLAQIVPGAAVRFRIVGVREAMVIERCARAALKASITELEPVASPIEQKH